MRTASIPPATFQGLFLVGNLAYLGAWLLAFKQPAQWQVMGAVCIALFFLLRVGGMWLLALRQEGEEGRAARRRAVLYTVVTLLAAGFWVVTAVRGLPAQG
ncbi:hypothetical protein FGE12_25765 [Aggregicoccus sp. 17bor-14]|uniref:hypothetical protein n=1 Tax=Myxococcaceae TaxID=31 RepID=UPI00129CAAA1|nr:MULTISPECIES: hypothetical protein [Myxococcaceae]MBF5045843.1 hypothetical protein [Simulacricoccus sp. 17bor-14]MRI91577.1 hypothetical protein [Aggregicoccus sp. 17bor-14]